MKHLHEITRVDERQKLFASTIADRHAELSAISLNDAVPDRVKELFDTARNVSLYSWFVYDFHPVADLTGFLALEAAFRARAEQNNKSLATLRLKELVRYALREGWVTEEGVTPRREIARATVEYRKSIEATERMKISREKQIPLCEPTVEEIEAESESMSVIETICLAGVDLRNLLAHGERMLVPGSEERLRTTADIINQLFRD